MISTEIYLKSLFSSFIKYLQSLPVDIREDYPKIWFSVYDTSSDNSEVCIVAELKNLRLFILMISRLKKVFAHCIDIVDSDYNRIRMRNQLVRKWTLKYLAKVFSQSFAKWFSVCLQSNSSLDRILLHLLKFQIFHLLKNRKLTMHYASLMHSF